jgi:hypothetical protein
MKSILAGIAFLTAAPLAQAALVITEFGLAPNGQEFVVVANTGGGPVNLANITISVNNGATISSLGSASSMAVGDTAIIARQTIPNFVITYGSAPVLGADYFLTIAGLDFIEGSASQIILYDQEAAFYGVGYGSSGGGGGYTGNLCIVNNSGPAPSTSANTTAFSTVPEPGSVTLSAIAALGLLARRRRI